jgi:hypothetical protein
MAAGVPIAVLLLRNVYLVGSWKGGNTKAISESALYVGRMTLAAFYQLFLGALEIERLGIPEVLLALAGVVYGFLVMRAWRRHRESILRNLRDRRSLLPLLTYLGVYVAAMIYLTFFSITHISPRYCYPLLPLLLLLIGLLITVVTPHIGRAREHNGSPSTPARRAAFASLLVVVASYLFLNVRDTLQPRLNESAFIERRIAGFLQEPTPPGESLQSWVEDNIPADANIVATDGQPTAYVLHRKTVSLVGPGYSEQAWEEPQVEALMARFHADFLVLYLGTPTHPVPVEQRKSRFLTALTRGEEASDWLRLAARNAHMMVFRRIARARRGAAVGGNRTRFTANRPGLRLAIAAGHAI